MHLVYKEQSTVFPVTVKNLDAKKVRVNYQSFSLIFQQPKRKRSNSKSEKPKALSSKDKEREKRWAKSKDELGKSVLNEMREFVTPAYLYKAIPLFLCIHSR